MTTTVTQRVSQAASGGKTRRVAFRTRLELEGDAASGFLLLEGDFQTGTDVLSIQGDMASPEGTITKRVS